MKKKGFTLIELLAVIIVLAVIAVIVTPIVTKTIKNAKKGSAEIATKNYIKAVDLAVSNSELNKKSIPDGSYTIDTDGNLIGTGLPDGKLEIDASGDRPTGGTIVIKDGQVTTDSTITVGDYEVVYNPTTKSYEATEKGNSTKTYSNGEIVYFNVTSGTKCSSSNYAETQSNNGVKSGCMKFYAFNYDGGDTVNLLLDHNTTATVAWNSNNSNASGPKEVLTQLKADTDEWNGTITPSNYTMYQTGETSDAKYTIDYSGYKARLITAQEVATITGNTSWNEKNANSMYYLDTNTMTASTTCTSGDTSGCKYGWLYDRTNKSCTTYGCLNNSDKSVDGYWTATSRADVSLFAWEVSCKGYVHDYRVNNGISNGVRPVIEVLKSKLS